MLWERERNVRELTGWAFAGSCGLGRSTFDGKYGTEFFSAERFRYEAERDVYLCPAGNELHLDRPHSTERSLRYRARAKDCNHCPLKAQCTTSKQGRTFCRRV